MEYNLVPSTGITMPTDAAGDQTLLALHLCPSAILHFTPAVPSSSGYLKDELMVLIQPV